MHDVTDPDAVIDPHFEELRRGRTHLPESYLPPSMPGQVYGWRRGAAFTVIAMMTGSTCAGICLTYGPEMLWKVLGIN